MSARILVACACVVVGLGAIVAVASTAGPPEGYLIYHGRDIRVDLPDDFRTVAEGQRDVIIAVVSRDRNRDRVEVATVPARGRSTRDYDVFTLENVFRAAPNAEDVVREDTDVPGADEARRITYHDPDRDRDGTIVIARDGERFVTLSINVGSHSADLDVPTVEDSFAITS
jgi:hypothetical protein